MIWCVYVACVLQPHSRQSQEPKWWMKRGFCLIIGIINFSIPSAQPGQQITVCCPTTDTHQQLSSDGIYSREIWKVNNVLQLLNLLDIHSCFWKTLNWIESIFDWYRVQLLYLSRSFSNKPMMAYSRELADMNYNGLSWTVIVYHRLS